MTDQTTVTPDAAVEQMLTAVATRLTAAQAERRMCIQVAREAGWTWRDIGDALGCSHQTAKNIWTG